MTFFFILCLFSVFLISDEKYVWNFNPFMENLEYVLDIGRVPTNLFTTTSLVYGLHKHENGRENTCKQRNS